jgi:hypothetical protein
MNVLTTKELTAYRNKVKDLMNVVGTDGATVLTALRAFDDAKQDDRLNHAMTNLIKNYAPQGAVTSGITGVTIGTAGTGYVIGDKINIGSVTGKGGVVTVATIGGGGDVLTVSVDSTGYNYTGVDTATSTAGDGTFAGTLTVGTVQPDEQVIVDAIIATLNP